MAQVSTSLDVKELERLDSLADQLGLSRSAVLRVLVTGTLRNLDTMMRIIVEGNSDPFSLDETKAKSGSVTAAEAEQFFRGL